MSKIALGWVAAALYCSGCATDGEGSARGTRLRVLEAQTWSQSIADWPEASRKVAIELGQTYGTPDELTATQVVWHNTGPWKRSVLSREPVAHAFPTPHEDVLEQVIDLRVPPERVGELAKLDGNVVVDRATGELSARGQSEAENFLAINLAREIALGQRTAQSARELYERAMAEASSDARSPYLDGLIFTEASYTTEDPERAAPAQRGEAQRQGREARSGKRAGDADKPDDAPKPEEF